MNLIKDHFHPSSPRLKWLSIVAIIFSILLSIVVGLSVGSAFTYKDKFFPNTKIGVIDVGNRTQKQALDAINTIVNNISDKGIIIKSKDNGTSINLSSTQSSTDPDLSKIFFSLDPKTTVDSAWSEQHQNFSLLYLTKCFSNTLTGWRFKAISTINNDDISDLLKSSFSTATISSQPSSINFNTQPPSIKLGSTGTEIDYDYFSKLVAKQISNLDISPIIIYNQTAPKPIESISYELQKNIDYLASNTPSILVSNGEKSWQLPFASYRNWLELIRKDNKVVINLNKDLTTPFWDEIKKDTDVPVQNARFTVVAGRVKEFKSSSDGTKLNVDLTLELINQQLNSNELKPVVAVIDIEKSTVNNNEVNNLGVDEIIGVGRSNFKGSPKNRRHNIATGANTLNGVLISPNEDFSLVKTLGAIDGTTGYLEELVIKGNQTKPEFGGGLCQIGTTVFRAALSSGLPILERRNHTYRVVYYEPAGTDATIYDPKPDLRFKNDTGSYILMQTNVKGDDLIIEFWGTKDGRKVEQSKPVISNIVAPGEPQMIETDELKPGETKCIETPHAGADVFFDYKVTYPNEEVKSQRFSSHYIPWTKKCLIGRVATSTPSSIIPAVPSTTPSSTLPANQ